MSRRLFAALLAAPPILALTAALIVHRLYALDLPEPLSEAGRLAAMAPLRGVVDGATPERPAAPELQRRLAGDGPVVATVWIDGRRAIRVQAGGPTVADAIHAVAERLHDDPVLAGLDVEARRRSRIQLDLVVARGRIPDSRFLRVFALVPGMDGLGARVGDRDVLLGADEMMDDRLLNARPLPFAPEIRAGLDFQRSEALLAQRAALPAGGFAAARRGYFRFRAESMVERPAPDREAAAALGRVAVPLPLVRGLPPGPPVTRETLLAGARAGGDYLVAHLDANGRFVYEADLATGERTDPWRGPYSLPRHAGTTYYLAQLYRATRDPALRAAVESALAHLAMLVQTGRCHGTTASGAGFSCVADRGHGASYLGSTALAVVAFAEFRLATGDTRFDDLHRHLAEHLLDMQRPDGSFVHVYEIAAQERLPQRLLYFDGEAALALARSYEVFADPRMVPAVEKALDHSIAFYDFFAGRFFVGEEHWTCIAAEAAWPELRHPRYLEFCRDYGAFLRRQQVATGDFPAQPDLAGAYMVTPFVIPNNTPVGSRTETMISAWQLSVHHGAPDEDIRRQALAAAGYLLRQQIRADNDWWVREPGALGGMPGSPVDRSVRIDYVQHTCSAMLRAIEMIPAP